MARFFKKTQTRAIIKYYGLYMVKTPDMRTLHRTFMEAVDMYHMVYGPNAPIVGPIDGSFKPEPLPVEVKQPAKVDVMIEAFTEQSRDLLRNLAQDRAKRIVDQEKAQAAFEEMAKTYADQVISFEEVMRKSHGIRAKVMEERIQRMKDRVKYCESMAEQIEMPKAA